MEATETRLFVYGSLKAGFEHHAELRGARFEAAASTAEGYRLVMLEGYPALVARAGAGAVTGEVYWVTPELLAALDRFEDCPRLYQRRPVTLADGSAAEAYSLSPERAERCPELAGSTYLRSDIGTKLRSS